MKQYIFLAAVLALGFSSCQKEISDKVRDCGKLIVNADILPTKAASVDEIKSNLIISVTGTDFHAYYKYAEIPDYIDVPTNSLVPYTIYAETISQQQATYIPDEWGQIRYAGQAEVLVNRIDQPTEALVHCTVANSQVSVYFDQSVLTYFSDCMLTVTSPGGRKLVFTPDNAGTAVAYMTSGEKVTYEFSGIFNIPGEQGSVPRTLDLEPAMHYTINVKMGNVTGSIGQPVINLVTDCEDLYSTMTVDPSQDGVNNMENQNE